MTSARSRFIGDSYGFGLVLPRHHGISSEILAETYTYLQISKTCNQNKPISSLHIQTFDNTLTEDPRQRPQLPALDAGLKSDVVKIIIIYFSIVVELNIIHSKSRNKLNLILSLKRIWYILL